MFLCATQCKYVGPQFSLEKFCTICGLPQQITVHSTADSQL